MSTISFSGLASGLDTSSIISQLMSLARQPETQMKAQQSTAQGKINEFNKIESAVNAFKDVADGFTTADSFSSMAATAANSSVLSATATGSATPGTHTVQVLSLAKMQRQVTNGVSSSSALIFNSGSFDISDGVAGHNPIKVNIAEGQNSLQGLAAAINASGAKVNASIVNDGTNYRLVVNGTDTNNYTLDFSNLSTAPAGGTGSLVPTMDNSAYQAGTPASMVVDGISMTKTSNTVTDAIQGVSFNLLSEGSSTTISVTNDTDTVKGNIQKFIDAYNSALSLVNSESKYDPNTKTAGVLAGDPTVQTIKMQLQSLLTSIVPGSGSIRSLADLGITTDQNDGTISVKDATLSAALSNHYSDVVNLFSHNGDTLIAGSLLSLPIQQYGIAKQFSKAIESMVNPYVAGSSMNGSIEIAKNGLNNTISSIGDQITQMEQRLTMMQTNMQNQFNALETTVSKLQSQGNMLLNYLGTSTTSSSSKS